MIVNIDGLLTSPDRFSNLIALDGELEAPYTVLLPKKTKVWKEKKLSSRSG